MLQLGFMWRSHGCFRNLRDDLKISVDFFCEPCAQMSKSIMAVAARYRRDFGVLKIEVRHVSEVSLAKDITMVKMSWRRNGWMDPQHPWPA